ncbi:hypothetical protein DRJ17_07230 [Candidatus Woesearchaeota archaeon]|nr:MAG: hypothetical protein DRJ17_07230 [Candidatus Woesearchaeota archaeon]
MLFPPQKDKDGKWHYVGKTRSFDEKNMTQLLQKRFQTDKPPVNERSKNGMFRFPTSYASEKTRRMRTPIIA